MLVPVTPANAGGLALSVIRASPFSTQVLDQPFQAAIATTLVEHLVKCHVQLLDLSRVVFLRQVGSNSPRCPNGSLVQVLNGLPQCFALEHGSYIRDLGGILFPEFGDDERSIGAAGQQPFRDQAGECLAHWLTTYAKPSGDLFLTQW
jgi:hypothetical protein